MYLSDSSVCSRVDKWNIFMTLCHNRGTTSQSALREPLSLDIYLSGENRSTGPSHYQDLLVQKMVERRVSQFGTVRSVSTSVKI